MLSREYDVKELCDLMGVSRAGYYKWKKRGKPAYQDKREQVIALVTKIHTEHPSHGYRWVAAFIQINEGVSFSDNYVYKAFRFLGFQSETKHKEHSRPRKVRKNVSGVYF
jgi:hypothetical protein